ncbi:hypothetical protein FOG51_01276 [Hanseniaspora uvarum]|jgi:aurora kinase, other|uniref:Aurora kinase n=1 Tax=Hanseniaspora uvarum TaxID=29833 RepID=A0A1E5RRI8_HANUV|nr:hypothetical protein FOG48_03235 [Hanseniaspora uvarum]KAF0273705.1 hypothetical protein FOG51_01276 [Hanseniaspora uvarum]KAF0275755.1 hypothetical protein FOG50_03381 [Hanseniaspora uvarum]OEJ89464.1 Spindle assembly checkpoint kinase [Hanseniaspora uvarum]GMM42706.1 aurora kinase [Hanseniaspora uvarum]
MSNKNLKISDFEIGKTLGKGKLGRVYCCQHKSSGYIVAIKVMNIKELKDFKLTNQLKREISIQGKLQHKSIIKLYNWFYDKKRIYLIMEYCYNGELFKTLQKTKNGILPEFKVRKYISDLLMSFKYLQDNHILHRDLKPENILLDEYGDIKLTDFGWATQIDKSSNSRDTGKRTTLCGTLDYLSPEIIKNQEYDHKVDNWALGVLTFELLFGYAPFEHSTKEKTYKMICDGAINWPTDNYKQNNVSSLAKDFIGRLLVVDVNKRMSIKEAIAHSWFKTASSPTA